MKTLAKKSPRSAPEAPEAASEAASFGGAGFDKALSSLITKSDSFGRDLDEARARKAVEQLIAGACCGLAAFDHEGRLSACNPAWLDLVGFQGLAEGLELREILAQADRFGGGDARRSRKLVEGYLEADAGEVWERQFPDGASLRLERVQTAEGFVDTLRDVTEQRQELEAAAYRARHDNLTSLPNRIVLIEHLQDAVEHAQRGEQSALICLDLDGFKRVNDSFGHAIGDALLEEAAQRLRLQLRGTDTAVRLGGDEFAMVHRCLRSPREALAIAQRVIAALSSPFHIGGQRLDVGASAGIQLIDGGEPSPTTLMRHGDLALYRAKAEGKGRACFYEPLMQVEAEERRKLENDLRAAVMAGQFVLFYQAKIDVGSGAIRGFEALVRWTHPSRGLIEPNAFIPLAEEIGLMPTLGAQIIETACAEAMRWPGEPCVSVNLSLRQFEHDGLVDVVAAALRRSGLRPDRLEIEIDHRFLNDARIDVVETLRALKALGVQIALDNLSIGPKVSAAGWETVVDCVKIDTSSGLISRRGEVIEPLTSLYRTLGLKTNAGRIERSDQLMQLSSAECDTVQGFALGRPVPAAEVPAILAADAA